MKKVLVIEDNLSIVEMDKLYLEKEGYSVSVCTEGDKAVATFNVFKPDIIILDLMLPGMDGYDICKAIRKISNVPIIMATAKTDTFDEIIGLELGADYYIAKPYEGKALVAKVKAVLRRCEVSETKETRPFDSEEEVSASERLDIIEYPGLVVDKNRYVVTVDGEEVYMPPKELELLFFLASNPNRVFNREQLLANVWGYENFVESRTVDVHVKRIREKIERPNHMTDWYIRTVWSVGYKFETRVN